MSDAPARAFEGQLARVRVAVARAKDDLAEGRMPVLSDLQSLVAGVCASVEGAANPGGGNIAQAEALEAVLAELNALENEVRLFRNRLTQAKNKNG
jgi:hypothetical protein